MWRDYSLCDGDGGPGTLLVPVRMMKLGFDCRSWKQCVIDVDHALVYNPGDILMHPVARSLADCVPSDGDEG